MQLRLNISREQIPGALVTALFALFVVMLPRFTDTAKIWFVLLILTSLVYLVMHIGELKRTDRMERFFFVAMIVNFLWMTFSFYFNGEPGRGANYLWGRHFYFLFLIPMFFMFRHIRIPTKILMFCLVASTLVSFLHILLNIYQGIDYRAPGMIPNTPGMNPNKFGPIQLCLSGMLFFYFLKLPSGPLRWLALAGFAMGLATVILSLSRTTWVTLAALCVFFVFYLVRGIPVWKKLALAGVIMVLLASSFAVPMVKQRVDLAVGNISKYVASDDYQDVARTTSFGIRLELWKTGWKMFLESPLTGVGVGGFPIMAKANSERYQVNEKVGYYKYVHNQYIAALATRGFPGLILFLLLLTIPLYIAMSQRSFDLKSEVARLSLMFICLNYLIGCLTEDHFAGKSVTMFVSVFVALLLARLSTDNSRQAGASPE